MGKRHSQWTWFGTRAPAPIPDDGLDRYQRRPLFGRFGDGNNVFGPYRRPIVDATGGGSLVMRQMRPESPAYTVPQYWTPVGIAGDGAELTGNYGVMGLVDVTTNSNGNGVV